MTSSSLCKCFRLLPKSMTLDDLEHAMNYAMCFITHAFLEPTTKIWMKIDPYYWWRRCSPITLDSGNIRFMRIFAWLPWREAQNDSGVIKNINFQGFQMLRLRNLRKWGQHYYILLWSPLLPFHWLQNTWPWMTSNFVFYCIVVFYAVGLRSALFWWQTHVCLAVRVGRHNFTIRKHKQKFV